MATLPQVFISYSHRDKLFAEELMTHLTALSRNFAFDVWSDHKISPGDSWKSEIEFAIEKASVALVLVSADYLASDWIVGIELPRLLERANRGETRVIPIILRACAWAHTPLAYFQVLPRDAKPFSELEQAQRDRTWLELTELLEAELHRLTDVEGGEARPTGKRPQLRDSPRIFFQVQDEPEKRKQPANTASADDQRSKFFISHAKEDGDFAENLKGRLREVGFYGWIDVDVLEAGDEWRKEIDEAILDSQALILVLSPDSKSSEYVTYEWAFALGSGLRIVPLMLRDTAIHPRLEVFQYLDFTNRRARPWSRLVTLLHEVSKAASNKRK